MDYDELRKLQLKSLEMAEYFVKFCKENDLLCYLCGGGCIGAIRHGGFIPWDDDLDFFMPRKDYEKLILLWKHKSINRKYVMVKSNKDFLDRNLFVTIRDKKTTCIKTYQEDLELVHGVALDILPLDGYPDKWFQRKIQCVWALIYSLFCAQTIPVKHGKLKKMVAFVLLNVFRGKRVRFKIWEFAEKQMTKYRIESCKGITELCSGPGYMRNWYPKEAFSKAIYKKFEDTTMPIPVGYERYLKIAFGEYMELPPEEKRKPHHDSIYIDLETSYQEYRGLYYKV